MYTKGIGSQDFREPISKSLQAQYDALGIVPDSDEPEIVIPGSFNAKCLELGEYGQRLLREYNYEENEKRGLYINEVGYGSVKKALWTCLDCGNTWEADFCHRVMGRSCNKCGYTKMTDTRNKNKLSQQGSLYDWALTQGDFGRKLIAEIDEEANERDGVSPHDVTYKSCKLLNWKCSVCGYKYKRSAGIRSMCECPLCDGKVVKEGYNDAYSWCLSHGELGEQIIEEFDTEKNDFTLKDITRGSNKIVQWKCKKGHTWKTSIHNRASIAQTMCPYCTRMHTSFAERYIYHALDSVIDNVERNYKKLNGRLELDVYIPDYHLAIEYDGYNWHNKPINFEFSTDSKEQHKTDVCKEKGIRLIHIYDGGDTDDIEFKNDIISFNYKDSLRYKQLNSIVNLILNELCINKQVDFEDIKERALSERKAVSLEDSLEGKFPQLAQEWHPILNKIQPTDVSYGSGEKVYWKCTKCNYGKNGEWKCSVGQRTNFKTACPKCRYSILENRHKGSTNKKGKPKSNYMPGQFSF